MRKITKRAAIFAAAGAVAVATAGTAWAVWSANGTGSASAAAGSSVGVVASTATVAPGQVLVPGGSASVFLKISNPNNFPVKVTAIADNPPITADTDHPDCDITGVTFADQAGLNIALAANAEDVPVTLTNAASMDNSSDDGCQGATFTIPVSLTAVSNAT